MSKRCQQRSLSILILIAGAVISTSMSVATAETPREDVSDRTGDMVRFQGVENPVVRVDLAKAGIQPRDYDLIKLDVKADRGAFLRLALENYPHVGVTSYWYCLDTMRGDFDWRTIWVDLRFPEEIKYKVSGNQQVLRMSGSVRETGHPKQKSNGMISVRSLRFTEKLIDIDWDQRQVLQHWLSNGDLVADYPLTVTNRTTETLVVSLEIKPFQAKHATATMSVERIEVLPKATASVTAKILLPSKAILNQDPLYCERFEIFAWDTRKPDSDVTILRSSDPIHLTVTVPVPEERVQFPLFPRVRDLPANLVAFDPRRARQIVATYDVDTLIEMALQNGIYIYEWNDAGLDEKVSAFRKTLVAAAYLYDVTEEPSYLATASQMLDALPRIWAAHYQRWTQLPVREISNGIICYMNGTQRWHYTLGLGWRLAGTQRSPYQFSRGANARDGTMSSMIYAFDLVAQDLAEPVRRRFIQDFLLPAGIQCRNHYIGDGNQQATANAVTLYAGLAARNWPLVSFAYSSEHGFRNIMVTCFDRDGVQIRKNYQTYTIRPMLWASELLFGCGINTYQEYANRYRQLVYADPAAKDMGQAFEDIYFWEFVESNRLRTAP